MELSIIVPVYNTEQYLPRCLDSILAQTFADYELILIDDGSHDNSPAICDKYAKKDARIRVVHTINQGVSAARNTGLDLAQGKHIAFVDSDDFIHPQMYEILLGAMHSTGADIVQCGLYHTADNPPPAFDTYLPPSPRVITHNNLSQIFYPNLWNCISGHQVTKLYKRKIFQSTRFPIGKRFEDIAILPELLGEGQTVALLDLPLYYYYMQQNGFMYSPPNIKKVKDHLDAYWQHHSYYLRQGNRIQALRAQDAYWTMYAYYKLHIWFLFPKLKKEFQKLNKQLPLHYRHILFNSQICRLKKLSLTLLLLFPRFSLGIFQKYYPECVPNELSISH